MECLGVYSTTVDLIIFLGRARDIEEYVSESQGTLISIDYQNITVVR